MYITFASVFNGRYLCYLLLCNNGSFKLFCRKFSFHQLYVVSLIFSLFGDSFKKVSTEFVTSLVGFLCQEYMNLTSLPSLEWQGTESIQSCDIVVHSFALLYEPSLYLKFQK